MVERLEERTLLAGLIPDLYALSNYQDFYSRLDEVPPSDVGAVANTEADQYVPFTLDRANLEAHLRSAPLEAVDPGVANAPSKPAELCRTAASVWLFGCAGVNSTEDAPSTFTLSIPTPDGTLQTFDVVESPVLEPELAAAVP